MKQRIGTVCIAIGVICLIAAAGLFIYNQVENWQARLSAESLYGQLILETDEASMADPYADLPIAIIDGNEYIGTLAIPSLELELPICNTWDYALLKLSPCRYSGHPGTKDFVICAHNYAAHFGSLQTINAAAEVIFTAMDGRTWRYEVVYVGTYQPTEVERMISGEYDLTLFTCTYGGRTRVTVGCRQVQFS